MTQLSLAVDVVAAAREYLAACREVDATECGPLWQQAINRRALAFHDLAVAAGEPCQCDPGSCPARPFENEEIAAVLRAPAFVDGLDTLGTYRGHRVDHVEVTTPVL